MTSSFIRSTSVVPPARYSTGAPALDQREPRERRSGANGSDLARRAFVSKSAHRSTLHLRFSVRDSGDDVRVSRAAAKIAAHVFADRVLIARVPLLHAADGRHDLARRAIAALEGVVIDKGLLHRMQGSVRVREPLDCAHPMALGRDGEGEARKDPHAVDMHRARPTLTMITALLRARQTDVLAQGVKQGRAHVQSKTIGLAIDRKSDRNLAVAVDRRHRLRRSLFEPLSHKRNGCGGDRRAEKTTSVDRL